MIKRSLMLSLLLFSASFIVQAQEPVAEVACAKELKETNKGNLKELVSGCLDAVALAYYPANKKELVDSCDTCKLLYANIYDLLKCLTFGEVLKIKEVLEPMIHCFIDSANEEQNAMLSKVFAFFEALSDGKEALKLTIEQKRQIKDRIEEVMNIVKSNTEAVKFVDNIKNLKLS